MLIKQSVRQYCSQKNVLVRMPLLIYFAYVGFRHFQNPFYTSALKPLNLGIHEFGHLLFSPLPMIWQVAGGSLMQLLAPFYGMYNFWKQRDYFSAVLCMGWYSTNCFDVARYAGDARAMQLSLVSPFGGLGGEVVHDWNYLLSQWGLLDYDYVFAFLLRLEGFSAIMLCLGLGAWMIRLMLMRSKDGQPIN